MRWADFVAASDQLLRNQIAPGCEKALGIKLTLEMINASDIQARVTSAVQSGSGPEIILVVNNWPQLYSESVADVSDVAEEIGKAQGGFYDVSRVVANDGKRWIATPWTVGGALLTNRRSWFAEIGQGAKDFLRWIHSKPVYDQWFTSQQAFTLGPTAEWQNHSLWQNDLIMLPLRSLAEIGRVAGYAGPLNRAAAEVVTKYIITDIYAKAVQGMPAESAVKWAHGELVKLYT